MPKLEERSVVHKAGRFYVSLPRTGVLVPAGGYSREEDAWSLMSILNEHKNNLLVEFIDDDDEEGEVEPGVKAKGRSRRLVGIERRTLVTKLEFRAAGEGTQSPGTIVGYAALFDTLSEDLGGFKERISPGAFARALKQSDIRSLRNHEVESLLGRCSSGTLRLAEDDKGLRMEVDLPDTTTGRDTAEMIKRGDMTGCSFSFSSVRDEWNYDSAMPMRTLVGIDSLSDVGPVTYPAYSETSVAMRSLEANRPKPVIPLDVYKLRLRLAESF